MPTAGTLLVTMGMDIAKLKIDADKAVQVLNNVDKNVIKMHKSFENLTNVYSYANQALKRMQNIISGMAFGVVVGAVSAIVQSVVQYYRELKPTDEMVNKLSDSIDKQRQAWNLIEEPINKVTQSTINLHNAQLERWKFLTQNEGPELRKTIEQVKETIAKNDQWINSLKKTTSAYFDVENSLKKAAGELLKNKEKLAEATVQLEIWEKKQKVNTITLDEVTAARKDDNNALADRTPLMLEAIRQTEEMNKQQDAAAALQLKNNMIMQESIQLEREARNVNYELAESVAIKTQEEINNLEARKEAFLFATNQQILAASSPQMATIVGAMEKIKALEDFHREELDLLQQKNEAELAMLAYHENAINEIDAARTRHSMAWKEMDTKQSIDMDKLKWKVGMQTLGNLFSQTGQMMMAEGKKNFEMGKKFAIAGVIINTAGAVMAAMDATPIYYVNIALAAATAAMGAAQIGIIQGTEYGGGGSYNAASIPSGTAASASSASYSDYGGYGAETETMPTQNITINVYNPLDGKVSDELADAIIQAINNAPNRNVTINAQAVY